MSPSSHLCLFTFVVLILPSRGQTPKEVTSSFVLNQTSGNTHVPVPNKTSPEVQSTPPTPILETDEATQSQTVAKPEIQTPKGMDTTDPVTDPGTPRSRGEGTPSFPGIGAPNPKEDIRNTWWYHSSLEQDQDENSPFYYDESTLRKRGLLVAAVLFITGIIILTSGKCREFSRMCLNRHRAYRVVNEKGSSKEEAPGGSQA